MIHEFTVDPDALAGWHNFRYLVEKFGVANGRLISRFPKEWKRMVYQACEACPDVEKKRIVVALEQIDDKLLAAGRTYDRTEQWVPNALRSHAEKPFQGIVTVAEKIAEGGLLDAATLSDASPGWRVDRGGVIPRTAEAMAAAAAGLLGCSTEIRFVDQYFSGSARHGRPLTRFIAAAFAGNSPVRRMEYHLSVRGVSPDHFSDLLERQRRHLALPERAQLLFVRWESLDEGDNIHPRYILTERGGLRFEVGLDEGDDGETTDVECVSETIYRARWPQYDPGSGVFRMADAWIVTADGVSKADWNGEEFVETSL